MSMLATLLSSLPSTVHVHPLCIYVFHNTVSNLLWGHHSSKHRWAWTCCWLRLPSPSSTCLKPTKWLQASEATQSILPGQNFFFFFDMWKKNKYWNVSCKSKVCVADTNTSSSNWDELNYKPALRKRRLQIVFGYSFIHDAQFLQEPPPAPRLPVPFLTRPPRAARASTGGRGGPQDGRLKGHLRGQQTASPGGGGV